MSATPDVIELPAPRSRRKGSTRRPAADPASAQIHLRIRPAVKEQVQASAKAARMTVTDYLLRNEAGSRRRPAPVIGGDPHTLVKILGELGKWGSNWNQLARDRNMTGRDPELDELRRIREALWEMRGAVMQALGA